MSLALQREEQGKRQFRLQLILVVRRQRHVVEWYPVTVVSVTDNQLTFEVISRRSTEDVLVGGPQFSTIPIDLVPTAQATIGAGLLLWLSSPHDIAEVKVLPVVMSETRDVLASVSSFEGEPHEFVLHLSSSLTLDGERVPLDAAYAIITDAILARGWTPNGVFEVSGGRLLAFTGLS